ARRIMSWASRSSFGGLFSGSDHSMVPILLRGAPKRLSTGTQAPRRPRSGSGRPVRPGPGPGARPQAAGAGDAARVGPLLGRVRRTGRDGGARRGAGLDHREGGGQLLRGRVAPYDPDHGQTSLWQGRRLQRDVAVLLRRQGFPLRTELTQAL